MELALDLGTKTGYCIRKAKGDFIIGMVNLSSPKNKYNKYKKFEEWLSEIHEVYPIKKIYWERVDFGVNTYATQAHGAFASVVNTFAIKNGIEAKGFNVGTIKKSLTGTGNATKMGMIHYAEKYVNHEILDDNIADAVGVMHTARKGAK